MRYYGQSLEDKFVHEYFWDYKGNLLSIGENDGQTFSNSKALIDLGWNAILFEPGSVVMDLYNLHRGNNQVKIFPFGIGSKEETVKYYQSGAHVPNGTDKGLVSTCNFEETLRWPNVSFEENEIDLVPFSMVAEYAPFDFISLDVEGMEWEILQQINLTEVGCSCLCIEWNSDPRLMKVFTEYCAGYGLELRHSNAENLIFCK